jgi:truncated hemoglobin YjbI
MTTTDYWAHVSASFVGTAFVVMLLAGIAAIAQLILNKRAKRAEARPETSDERLDEPVDEGKLRVAVRRSASPSERIPFRDDTPEYAPSGPAGASLFEPAVQRRQEHADAAAVRRGEETRPIPEVRREMTRVMIAEPPMIDGVTLFAYLKHHAPQPSGLAWDSENMGALANVTEALYKGVEGDRFVAPVFDGYDLHELRKHFVRALKTLAKDGLDVETADALGRAHAHLGIRPEQFDAVTGHLVQALKRYLQPRVFEVVVPQLSPAVSALRIRIVTR